MDVNEVRLRNYKTLMQQFRNKELERGEPERGVLNRFGEHVGISPRYLSHINNGRKHVGAETCRRIEQAFRLPHGWMDHDHLGGGASNTRAEREYLELALKLFRESPIEAQGVLLRYMSDRMLNASAKPPEEANDAKPKRRTSPTR